MNNNNIYKAAEKAKKYKGSRHTSALNQGFMQIY